MEENNEKELFKALIDKSIEENNMSMFYMLTVSLISADNNLDAEEIEANCKLIESLIEVLEDYKDNKELYDWKDKLIEYNKIYSPKNN